MEHKPDDTNIENSSRFRYALANELVDKMHNGVLVYQAVDDGKNFVLVAFNHPFNTLEALSREKVIGKRVTEVFPTAAKTGLLKTLQRVHQTGQTEYFAPSVYKNRSGGPDKWREVWVYKLPSGEVAAEYNDATERREAEEQVAQERDKAQQYLDLAGTIFIAINTNGEVTLINKKGCEILGYKEHEIIGKNWFDNFVPKSTKTEIQPVSHKLLGGNVKGAAYHENLVLTKSGEERLIAWHNTTISDESGQITGHLSSGQDITDQRRSDDELSRSEQRYRTLVENSRHGIIIVRENSYVYANQAYCDLIGYSSEELLNLNSEEVILLIREKDRQAIAQRVSDWLAGREPEPIIQFKLIHKNGSKIWVEAVSNLIEYQGQPAIQIMIYDISKRLEARKQLRKYSQKLETMVEKRTTKLKETQEKLFHTDKLAAIGQLASGVAHQLRNPLGVINNAAYFLELKLVTADDKLKRYAELIKEEVIKATGVINGILDFARMRQPDKKLVNMKTLITKALSNINTPKNITVETDYDENLPKIAADSVQLHQVVINVASNAIQAMPKGGTLSINGRLTDGFVEIEFKDTGAGIPEELLSEIFKPLFTTRSERGGTGIGLALCSSIISAHKGSIDVSSKMDEGTSFIVRLPVDSHEDL